MKAQSTKTPPKKHKNTQKTPKKHQFFFSRLRAKKKAPKKRSRLRAKNNHLPGSSQMSQKRRNSASGHTALPQLCALSTKGPVFCCVFCLFKKCH